MTARHYGSEFTMADYKSKTHNIYLTANMFATDKLRFTGTFTYNASTAEYDAVIMPTLPTAVTDDLQHQNFGFEEMHEYSNLDYKFIDVLFGLEYAFPNGVTYTADIEYADLTDDTGWVYGIESGSMLMVRTGIRLLF